VSDTCATVGDLKRLLSGSSDDTVVYFRIYDERDPETLRYASEVSDKETLKSDLKGGHQTTDGDRDVIRIYLTLDLDPCD
jgi:hypothetical protein